MNRIGKHAWRVFPFVAMNFYEEFIRVWRMCQKKKQRNMRFFQACLSYEPISQLNNNTPMFAVNFN